VAGAVPGWWRSFLVGSVFELLDREWIRLAADPRAAGQLVEVCEAAGGATSLAGVERFVRGADAAAADAVLVALAARAVEGDALAARVLLQLLLPGVRRLARTWWAVGDREERAAAAVAAAYDRIRRYPLVRRPRRVAVNVLMDAASDLRRVVRSMPPCVESGLPPGWEPPVPDPPGANPAIELAGALRDAVDAGIVTAGDAELIAASRIGGVPLAEIARRRGAKLRTLQWRRQRAEATLSRSASVVAAA
jgi:DNA-directed RNA polymerase specialized sigma24 family protein